jgi:hypothetical protein
VNPLEYLHLQLRLEGKEVINGNLLRQVEAIPGKELPLMILAQFAEQQVAAFYDESLSPEIQTKLNGQIGSIEIPKVDSILRFLQSCGFTVEIGHYKTYIFAANYQRLTFEEIKQFSKYDSKIEAFGFGQFAEEVYAVEQDGKIVSACVSARENDACGEAWVFTDVDYRHLGFAQKVVGAWATNLIAANKIPFYSHKMDNTASASLAKRLRIHPVFEEIVISDAGVSSLE